MFSAFLFASTVGVLVSGKLADRLGRKPVFLTGMGLFLAGSALCGLATSVPALIASAWFRAWAPERFSRRH